MMRLSEQILFLIQWGGRYFPELRDLLNKPYKYGSILPQNDRAVRRALNRLVKRGELARVGKRGKARYQLTKKGKGRMVEARPFLDRGEWDGKWRLVVFDIPERYRGMRAVLRRFLVTMGFVSWQRSLWISPFKVSREIGIFLEASRLSEMAYLMEVEKVYGVESQALAGRAWKLKKIAQEYDAFGMECERAGKVTQQHRKLFVKLIMNDPLLFSKLQSYGLERSRGLRAYRELIMKSGVV